MVAQGALAAPVLLFLISLHWVEATRHSHVAPHHGHNGEWANCTTQGCTKGGYGGQRLTNQPEWPWLRPKGPRSRPKWARSRPEWARSRPQQPWPQLGQLQLWPRIQQPGDQTTREFPGHWLSPDWALVWHHTTNHDQATTTVVGYPGYMQRGVPRYRCSVVCAQPGGLHYLVKY